MPGSLIGCCALSAVCMKNFVFRNTKHHSDSISNVKYKSETVFQKVTKKKLFHLNLHMYTPSHTFEIKPEYSF